MPISRLRRIEERTAKRTMILTIAGTVGILGILMIFGVNILVNFSVFLDKMRGSGPVPTPTPAYVLPPVLDALPEATNTATLSVSGKGNPFYSVTLIVNDIPLRTIKAASDGAFLFTDVKFADGTNTVRAKQANDHGSTSSPSEDTTVEIKKSKPKLELTSPSDGMSVSGDTNTVSVAGKTDDGNRVTVNDRFVIVRTDGTFQYDFPLPEGDTTLKITVTDPAGNQTTEERKVKYSK
jgi:hypothetical protein